MCTNSIEPTSKPRVGWLTIISFTSRLISLATTTFCWLPPDSVPAGVAVDVVRTSYSATRLTADSLMASRFSAIPEAYGGWS